VRGILRISSGAFREVRNIQTKGINIRRAPKLTRAVRVHDVAFFFILR
jgi:hypothetical protein